MKEQDMTKMFSLAEATMSRGLRLAFAIVLVCMILMGGCESNTEPKTVSNPTFSLAGGAYTSSVTVTISCATEGSVIRYTTNGTDPTESSTQYSSPIGISSTTTIKARAYRTGYNPSQIASATYTINIPTVATPTFNPGGGTYTSAQNVTISCITSGATIHYTTNGNDPISTSPIYSSPISVSTSTTIKAKAYKNGMSDSGVASATYTINISQVAPPTLFNWGETFSGNFIFPIAAFLSCTTDEASIHYTLDGSEPTQSSPQYSSLVTQTVYLVRDGVLKAKAFKTGMNPSNTLVAPFQIQYEELGYCAVNTSGTRRIIVSDGFAYMPGNNLNIINVQNPAQPVIVSTFSEAGSIYDVCLAGNYIYASGNQGLSIIDVSNKNNPVLVGQCATSPYGNYEGEIKGTASRVCIAFGQAGISLFNVSDKANPTLLDYLSQYAAGRTVELNPSANKFYYHVGSNIHAISATNSSYISYSYPSYNSSSNRSLFWYNNKLYASDSNIDIFDTSSSSSSAIYSGNPTPYYINPTWYYTVASGNRMYSQSDNVISVCQGTSSPVWEAFIVSYPGEKSRGLFVNNSYIYLYDGQRGFRIIEAPGN